MALGPNQRGAEDFFSQSCKYAQLVAGSYIHYAEMNRISLFNTVLESGYADVVPSKVVQTRLKLNAEAWACIQLKVPHTRSHSQLFNLT